MIIQEETLERDYLRAALKRSKLLRRNEPKKANKEYDKLYRLKEEMRQLPDKGEGALKRVAAATDDPNVKISAAAALLAIDEAFATALLDQVRLAAIGIPSFTAEMTLEEWRKGKLREYLR